MPTYGTKKERAHTQALQKESQPECHICETNEKSLVNISFTPLKSEFIKSVTYCFQCLKEMISGINIGHQSNFDEWIVDNVLSDHY